jgi:peroxiredoxin
VDSIGIPFLGRDATAQDKIFPPHENIIKYAEKHEIKDLFFYYIQENQYYYNNKSKINANIRSSLETIPNDWYPDNNNRYSETEVDCIISFCTVENDKGKEFVIIDSNNDEDFSNDELLEYKSGSFLYGDRTLQTESVIADAHAEIFNGEKIQMRVFPVSFRKVITSKKVHSEFGIQEIKMGKFTYKGSEYLAMLSNNPTDIEFTKFSQLWVDTNHNNNVDEQDSFVQVNKPFILFNKSFQLRNIDRFGNKLIIEPTTDEVIPPIAVGLFAPDFETVTVDDSSTFNLSALQGQFVLLDFWGTWCAPCIEEIPYLKEAYKKYSNGRLEIVSIGIDDPDKLRSFIREKEMNWIHIQQDKKSHLLELYQVSGYPSTYLIDKSGKIVAMNIALRGKTLISTLDKLIK